MVIISKMMTETITIKNLKLYPETWYFNEKILVNFECYNSIER